MLGSFVPQVCKCLIMINFSCILHMRRKEIKLMFFLMLMMLKYEIKLSSRLSGDSFENPAEETLLEFRDFLVRNLKKNLSSS